MSNNIPYCNLSGSSSLRLIDFVLAFKRRFPNGVQTTFYRRTCVEQFAPYVSFDGLVTKITRYKNFDCTEAQTIEEIYENRADQQIRHTYDIETGIRTDFFNSGREDNVISK